MKINLFNVLLYAATITFFVYIKPQPKTYHDTIKLLPKGRVVEEVIDDHGKTVFHINR